MSAVTFDAAVAPLVRHMQLVDRHRESLQRLQDIWDQLALLGRMSNVATDIGDTAEEFRALGGALLDSLAQRLLANTMHRMRAQAQVAIDILVRNLFERTADVGFLATDNAVCEFLRVAAAGDPTQTEHRRVQLQARFEAYVAKYSVYDDVIVLAPDGSVRARLDDGVAAGRCGHRLVSDTLRGDAPFVESFGAIDVLGGRRGLVYSAAIRDPGTREVLGVLCLSFRFDDEMKSIFTHLAPVGPCSVVALRDAKGAVLASSDVWQLPQGAVMAPAGPRRDRVFFAGREYLITSVAATGYQGYAGPGWSACTLVPLDQAFRDEHDELDPHDGAGQGAAPASLPPGALNDGSLFSQELRSIPLQARRIQRGLKRLVWNGEVRGRQAADRSAGGFGAALLQQITATGERITRVIEAAIGDLQQSAAAAFLDEARSCSALAIDIMDRNLYERANDCRWWALDAALQRALGGNAGASAVADASRVLAHINSLYTVYSSLLLLDAQGQVVAASNAAGQAWVGQRPDAPWVQLALQLRDGQAYVCSPFEASPLYDGRMTCVYSGAVRSDAGVGAALGAVAVVFDSEPQFEAMLRDTLPRDATGQVLSQAVGLFATRAGMIVSSTDTVAFPIGQALAFQQLRQELALLARGESRQVVLELDGSVYAVGVTMSRGYREYNNHAGLHDDDVACMVLVRLGAQQAGGDAVVQAEPAPLHTLPAGPRGPHGPNGSSQWRQLASFYCAGDWLALDAGGVVEAIHAAQLKMLPGSPAWMAGVMMCGDEAVPVVDLRALRNMAPRAANGEPVPVILCKNSGQATFGLRVDDLGQVMEIAPSAVHPLVGRLAAHDRHAEGVLSFGDAKARHMLTVLNLDRLASGLALRA